MKVLDLACQHGHSFEGWFGSEEDFQSQLASGLVQCPICDDAKITKKLSAPRLNLSGAKEIARGAMEAARGAMEIARGAKEVAHDAKSSDAQPANSTHAATTHSIALQVDSVPATGLKDSENAVTGQDVSHPSDHPFHALMRNPEFQAAYMHMAKEVLAKTDDVGNDFAREARKIHYGKRKDSLKERGNRGIRGQASHDETMELLDEGIDVMPLPLPKALKNTLQ